MRDAPTDPTDPRMEDGVEKIAVPIIRPILYGECIRPCTSSRGEQGSLHEEGAREDTHVTTDTPCRV